MSNQKQQNENELAHLRAAIESISACMDTGRVNSDGDLVLEDNQVTLIRLILEA